MATSSVPQAVTSAGSPANPVLPRALVLLIGAACAVVAAAGIRGAAEIVAPIMLSLVLTIAVLPLARWARSRGWPSWLGTLLALVAAYAILLVLVLGTALAITKLIELIPQYADSAKDMTGDAESFLTSHGVDEQSASTATAQLDPSKLVATLTDVLSGILGLLGNLFLLVTLLFFTCSAIPLSGPRFATLRRAKPEMGASVIRFVSSTQRYLIMTALFGAIVAVLDTGALWLLGVPLPLVWGLFSFITNFIPNIGFVIGVIPPALLALLDGGWAKAVTVVLVYSGLNVVIQTFIQPHFVGATVGISTELTFLSLVVWTFLLGALGALLAVPMTLLVRAIFLDPDRRTAWISPLISTTPEPLEE